MSTVGGDGSSTSNQENYNTDPDEVNLQLSLQQQVDAELDDASAQQDKQTTDGLDDASTSEGAKQASQALLYALNDLNLSSADVTAITEASEGTGSGALAAGAAVGDSESLKNNLLAGDSNLYSATLQVAAINSITAIQSSLGTAYTGQTTTLAGEQLDTGGERSSSESDQATMDQAEARFNNDMSVLLQANGALYTATGNYQNACSKYGADSKQAMAAENQVSSLNDFVMTTNKDAFQQVIIAQGLAGKYPQNESFQNTAESMTDQYGQENAVSATNTAASAAAMQTKDDSIPLTMENIFGNYNSAALAYTTGQVAIMGAMIHMSDITNKVAQQQTSIEDGMETMQTSLNNGLQQQLEAQDPILDHLAKLGKKEAKASRANIGFLPTLGDFITGASVWGLVIAAAEHKSVKEVYKNAWKGLGMNLGFIPPPANVEGEVVATNGRLTQLNSECQVATQKVSNITTSINAQGRLASASAQSVQSLNQMMTSSIKMWADAMSQAIQSGAA